MKLNKVKVSLLCLYLTMSFVFVNFGVNSSLRTQQTTTIYIDPTPVTAYACDNFTIAVNIRDVTDLWTWQFKLRFNPSLLECLSVTEGPFLRSSGPTVYPAPNINNTEGTILAGCSRIGLPPSSSGNGTLAYIKFHCDGIGECDLVFLYPDTFLLNFSMNDISHSTVNGHVIQKGPVHNIDTGLYYMTIQAAIDAPETLDGHTIVCDAGNYTENIDVYEALNIIGAGPEVCLVIPLEPDVDNTVDIGWSVYHVNITGFTITTPALGSGYFAVSFKDVAYCNFWNNVISGGGAGIEMRDSSNNSLRSNNIKNNQQGISLFNSSDNVICHNNFIDNASDGYSEASKNTWDGGYPSGGNYWSNYNGTDLYRGAYQNETGSDGIGDTQYIIDANNTDHYPLMGSFGSPTTTGLNVTVFPTPDVGLIFENVTAAGSTTVDRTSTGPPPPPGLELVGQFYDVKVTASYSGNITVRIIYDDSGMTQQEESTLRLLQWCLDPCDITGATPGVPDGICDMRDIGYLCTKFMTTPSSPDWDPKCDVSGPTTGVPDGIVDMRDIGFACSHFGLTSKWVNITTFIDTQNNLIYGETSHFSLIGIHRE